MFMLQVDGEFYDAEDTMTTESVVTMAGIELTVSNTLEARYRALFCL